MPRHTIELHDSFVDVFSTLHQQSQAEIAAIWKKLEIDPYYLPNGEDYLVEYERDPNDYAVVCQHVSGWGGWQLNWFFEYYEVLPAVPEYLILRLRYEPFEDIRRIRPGT